MTPGAPVENPVAELVARCIIALEHDGPEAVDAILAASPEEAVVARRQLEQLVDAGLLDIARAAERQVGPYRIVEAIGRGGMGTVYLAEQREPVPRTVALKVLRKLPWQSDAMARFERERDALARVEHPHICTVYDAGTTAHGQAWIAMEYVRGTTITEHCARRALGLAETLELFVEVCHAVQHAHHRGILHRDLKPSNILVRENGDRATPVIIDFGLAKAIEGRLADDELHTQEGWMLGTPGYMSPEQARRDQGVDTRTDVYSLGMVLFELLAGQPPVGADELRSATPVELQKLLESRGRKRPSQLAAAGGGRGRFAARMLEGDLDWIVARATDDDPERRYPMPVALADDIARYLRSDVVEARPPSAYYRFSRFVRRNRAASLAVLVAFVAMAAATVTSTVFYGRAQASAVVADTHRAHATRAVDAMLAEFARDDLANVPQLGPVRRRMLEEARGLYESILATSEGVDEDGRLARARTLVRLGRVRMLLDPDEPAGGEPLDEARAVYAAIPPTGSGADASDRLLCSYWSSKAALAGLDSVAYRERLEEVAAEVEGWRDVDPTLWPLLAESAVQAAFRFHHLPFAQREALFREARAIGEHLAASDPRHAAEAVRVMGVYADWLFLAGRPEAGREVAAAFRSAMEALLADADENAWPDARAKILATDGFLLATAMRETEAVERFEEALALHLDGLARDIDPRPRIERICSIELALIQCRVVFGGFDEARRIADASIARLRDLCAEGDNPQVRLLLAQMLEERGAIEADRGEFTGSIDLARCAPLFDESLDIVDALCCEHPGWHQAVAVRGTLLSAQARAYRIAGHPEWVASGERALAAVEEGIRVAGSNPNRELRLNHDRWAHARGLAATDRLDEAIGMIGRALDELAVLEERFENPATVHNLVAQAAADLAEWQLDRGELDRARAALERAMGCEANAVSRLEVVRLRLACAVAEEARGGDPAPDRDRAQRAIDEVRAWLAEGPAEKNPSEHFMSGRIEAVAAKVALARGRTHEAVRAARAATEAFVRAYGARPGWGEEELCGAFAAWLELDSSREGLGAAERLVADLPLPTVQLELARRCTATGEARRAIAALRRALALDPSLEQGLRDDPRLRPLAVEPEFRALLR